MAFNDLNKAIEMANDTPYGLQAAVFTQDISRAFDIAYRLEVGGDPREVARDGRR